MFDRLTSNYVSVDDSNTNRLITIIARCRYKGRAFHNFRVDETNLLNTIYLLPCDIGVVVADGGSAVQVSYLLMSSYGDGGATYSVAQNGMQTTGNGTKKNQLTISHAHQ
jgi:hypothetical protein